MPYLAAKIAERDELIAERESLNTQAQALYDKLAADGADEMELEAAKKLEEEGVALTARRNELDAEDGPIAALNAEIDAIQELVTAEAERWRDAPTYAGPVSGPASTTNDGVAIRNFHEVVNDGWEYGRDNLGAMFDRHGSIPVAVSGTDVKVVQAGGEMISVDAAAQRGIVMRPQEESSGKFAVGLTQVTQPNLMRYGLDVAMASGYAIDMVPTRTGPNRASSWSEAVYDQTPSAFWRSAQYADPTEFSPQASLRSAAPAEFAVEVQVSIEDSMQNPNIGELVQKELAKVWNDKLSPAFIYNDHVANTRTAICNSNLTGNGLIDSTVEYWTNAATLTAKTSTSAASGNAEAILYKQIRADFIKLQKQSPGQKVCLIPREYLEVLQEFRYDGLKQYPELNGALDNVSARGITYVPIDVGFATPAANTYQYVMTDWAANTELVVVGGQVSMLNEIMRRQGKYVLLFDGAAYWRVIDRFKVARGKFTKAT